MTTRNRGTLAALAVGLALLAAFAPDRTAGKKLIEWGWDEPDTAFLRANTHELERTPFDGCAFNVRYGPGGSSGSFTWQFWGRRRFERRDVVDAFADLRATHLRRFRETFLRVNMTPGAIDWFDDFAPIQANARLAGELASAGRARGILLDVEQYQGQPFEYRRQAHAATRSWTEYAAQVRARGRDVMTAFQEGRPGLTLFLSFGYTLPWVLSDHGRQPLSEAPYGLLPPFLDGLLDAAAGQTCLVDGYELSYGFKTPGQFDDARRLFESGVLPIVADARRYHRRMRLGFGLWLDYDWRRNGWSADETANNYYSPACFEETLYEALRSTDGYVWVYSETPRWWNRPDPSARVPDTYASALRRARAGKERPPVDSRDHCRR